MPDLKIYYHNITLQLYLVILAVHLYFKKYN